MIRPLLLASSALALIPHGAYAQSTPSSFQTGLRYDEVGQLVGKIEPDADGNGPRRFTATRTSYDRDGLPILIERGELADWQADDVKPSDWPNFTIIFREATAYDAQGRKASSKILNASGTAVNLTQWSYDALGRPLCTAVRMEPNASQNEPDACALAGSATADRDRITKLGYDDAGRLASVRKAVGTSLEQLSASFTYTQNGKQESIEDAGGNRSRLSYDGFDRVSTLTFPSPTTPGATNASDYEEYRYDENDNRTFYRRRDGRELTFTFDLANRLTEKHIADGCAPLQSTGCPPAGATRDVFYSYDLRSLRKSATFDSPTGPGITFGYNSVGELDRETSSLGSISETVKFSYDADGNRNAVEHTDGTRFTYDFDGNDNLSRILQNGTSEIASFAYDGLGRLKDETLLASQRSLGYDAGNRLNKLTFVATGLSATKDLEFNPASQIKSAVVSDDRLAWKEPVNKEQSYSVNGLNQYTNAGGSATAYDAAGNLIALGAKAYSYDGENRLIAAGGSALQYDPLGRLRQIEDPNGVVRFLYAGDSVIGEVDGSGSVTARYVYAGADTPIIAYGGSGLSSRQGLLADERGSIVVSSAENGQASVFNTYSPYGEPNAQGTGRFRFTGQLWLPQLDLYHYRSRMYSANLGRFIQTDPVGYADQMNLYSYVDNDPVNATDPTGMYTCGPGVGPAQCPALMADQRLAKEQLIKSQAALERLSSALRKGKLSSADTSFQQKINRYFGKGAGSDLKVINALWSAARKSLQALNGNEPIYAIAQQRPNEYMLTTGRLGGGRTSVEPAYLGLSARERANTLIHESTHRMLGTSDFGVYGRDAAAAIAQRNPMKAQITAENYSLILGFEE